MCVRIILPGDVISFVSTIKQRAKENSSTYINLQNRMESIFRLLKWSTAGSMNLYIYRCFFNRKKRFYLILDTCQFDQEKKKMTSDSLRHTMKKKRQSIQHIDAYEHSILLRISKTYPLRRESMYLDCSNNVRRSTQMNEI